MDRPSVFVPTPSFWARQFSPQRTNWQITFDVIFGILLPLLCLRCDPIVFRSDMGLSAWFGEYRGISYLVVAVQIAALTAWLTLHRLPALFAGILFVGTLFAGLIGLILLPFSIAGIVILIGLLGLTPLFTAFVFLRNAVRAHREAGVRKHGFAQVELLCLGISLALFGPLVCQVYAEQEWAHAAQIIRTNDRDERHEALQTLKRLRWLIDYDQLVHAFENETIASRRERMAEAFQQLTGEDIETRLVRLRD